MRYVIALGGNALEKLDNPAFLEKELMAIVSLYIKGNEIVLTHGNGPQVGKLADLEDKESLALLTAQTQAEIGLKLRRAVAMAVKSEDKVVVLLTRVVVDANSKDFKDPKKPIGKFYDKAGAERLRKRGYTVKKMIGGYRRVVPSPKPINILETGLIDEELKSGRIVIACGGGGIPVAYKNNKLSFVEAVIDKDSTAALLATKLSADSLLILTNVDGAYINFKKKGEKLLGRIKVKKLREYIKAGQFEEGSMKPKAEACVDFVSSTKNTAVIGNIARIKDVILLRKSTVIFP